MVEGVGGGRLTEIFRVGNGVWRCRGGGVWIRGTMIHRLVAVNRAGIDGDTM